MLGLKTRHSKKSAFTLVELLGVVSIVLVFSMLVMSSNRNVTSSAQDVTTLQHMGQLQTALDAWIASQTSMQQASQLWEEKVSSPAGLLVWADGPVSLMSDQFRSSLSVYGDKLVTPASQARKQGFVVQWGADHDSRMIQGPVVSLGKLQ
jgi:type II secretory pathway pseudopilin PulG